MELKKNIDSRVKDKIVLVLMGTKPRYYKYFLEYGAKAVISIEKQSYWSSYENKIFT